MPLPSFERAAGLGSGAGLLQRNLPRRFLAQPGNIRTGVAKAAAQAVRLLVY